MSNQNETKIEGLGDLAKKIILTSLGSASLAKGLIKETSIPKEILSNLLGKAEKTKDDLVEMLAREVSKFLGKVNVSEEVIKALKGLVINLSASIDFDEKKGGRPKTTIKKSHVSKK
ncbi:MAG: hypothetical protein A3G32_08440 [Deltaproteobacteria bacterium RIFCSPLOWO2_12_FULL_40_28]|nr:MAG: hypothetical protein A3C45_01140 [Deltaproteobacteria bacterium RIFCSPHIGHO2_02_FULL_40_28]OGQ20933.1 MAG: hypothetical protein A3E27_03805 [Deltaproteobacteria bacterium RIFCSPHIGHO2_12_FULL_40_32]OGQ39334.1 MAG: hypothetical protein A3I69_05165 [Deltaproteobacteria bacterium RIFCSPLOWO2_02_FULL_40_36]OGQ54615.1 MAG: hypothetical protein A3G32_08440 [Deltaproteobacteria bacterium RIFCSPLOWO2_12_FULL_40_28]